MVDLPVTKLWHVSDQDDISRFHPRRPVNLDSGINESVVWSVDDDHLTNYLLPRDCPRICLRVSSDTSLEDRAIFFGSSNASAVIIIEEPWYDRALRSPLWLYEMPPVSFRVVDRNAGYFVSAEVVDPVAVTEVGRPVEMMMARGTELRCVTRLRPLASQVARSTLAFSIIRL